MTHAAQNHARGAPSVLFMRAAVVDGSVDEETRSVDFICSTEDIDGHGTIVRQNWRLERFTPTGVVLYAHDHDDLPIGTATVGVTDGKLRARVTFSTADLNPQAELVFRNVKAGVIRGISPGFMPHTITFERHDDVEVMVLDNNELFELSVTPCPSNAGALAQMRSMASRATVGDPVDTILPAQAGQQTPPVPDGTATNTPIGEEQVMAENKTTEPTNVISIARALELPAGATEQDAVAAGIRLRQLEVQVQAITGVASTSEAVGALRAMKVNADKYEACAAELATVKAERDLQNFEALLQRGIAENKLAEPALQKLEREKFERKVKEGRGAEAVEELRGFLSVKAPDVRFSRSVSQPTSNAGAGQPLLWNGKAYRDLKPMQRARLSTENPELFRVMKDDHETAGAVA